MNENNPEFEGMFLILTPPISRDVHVFSGGLLAVGLAASITGATVDDGWLAVVERALGEPLTGADAVEVADFGVSPTLSPSLPEPLVSGGFTA